ncbi:MAG TPA: aconitase/3-isopropylmalate dehydratase large subunit family protein [Trebonia sp.]|jgi:3-isopropylmalate/(R)-2-methylmalate dehydratase large subunit|nr:aconitase/3-isopropylmalate dehydratase large subunit family protein [Trebonia sp.]
MHAIHKILAKHAGLSRVDPGQIVQATPDFIMLHDRGVARVRSRFEQMGAEQVVDPDKVVIVFDHFYPPPRPQDADSQQRTRAWRDAQGIKNFHAGKGIAHVIFPEMGYAYPGALIVGSDSHTTTNSALGCASMGLGHSDLASLLALGSIWLRVPEIVKVHVHGELAPYTTAKDIILAITSRYGEDACLYRGVEFSGPTISSMGMDGRLTLTNLAVDIGAKTGYVPPDEVTWDWMRGRRERDQCDPQTTDSADDFAEVIDIDAAELVPLVATPHNLSLVTPAEQLGSIHVDEAVLGTCTNGRLDDFRQAAEVLANRKVATDTRLVVNPGSAEVYQQAVQAGYIDTLIEAGAIIGLAGCGPCSGCNLGMLGDSEVAISSSSRNFKGRMGSQDSGIYVGSAASVAASAVRGYITDPRELANDGEGA